MTGALAASLIAALAAGQQAAAPFPGAEAVRVAPVSLSEPALCAEFDRFYDAVCASGGYPAAADQQAAWAKADIGDQAQSQVISEVDAACAQAGGCPDDKFNETYALAYARRIETLSFAKLGVTPAQFLAMAGDVKQGLLAAIDAQMGLSAVAKARFKRVMSADRVLLPSQFLQEQGMTPMEAQQALSNVCGSSGLATNAFADQGLAVMIFCPGYVIDTAAAFPNASSAQRLAAMEIVVAHELAHTIDNNTLSVAASYAPMASCVKQVAAAEPALFGSDLDSKFGELAADYWALETFRARHSSGDARALASFKDGLSLFCNSVEGQQHPSGRTRIELASRNPDVRLSFGCRAVEPSRPACGWTGRVP